MKSSLSDVLNEHQAKKIITIKDRKINKKLIKSKKKFICKIIRILNIIKIAKIPKK